MLTVHVLGWGELFQLVLNAIATFMKQNSFLGLLRITALAGIIMAGVAYLKSQDPMIFGKWLMGYILFIHVALLPKTSVLIDDISSQTPKLVDNVPVVFAMPASLITSIGYGLAQSYDALLSLPDDLLYTHTGSLFASRLIQAARDFHIISPTLKSEMDHYFRVCVVGDIKINHKYTVGELTNHNNIWELISHSASTLRMIPINGQLLTCAKAAKSVLRPQLEQEISKAYRFFGVTIFGKPNHLSYERLFETHLTSSFNYYQGLTDAASNIMLQSMMINAMKDGLTHYQAFTDSTASVVNQQFSKSQVQHRWSWQIAGLKALWFLPILHTILTVLLFGVFPVIVAASTVPGGTRLLFGYFQFFVSLQFWPVLFAILNAVMTLYGHAQSLEYGQITMVNLDKVDELHQDIAGVAGYMMLLIPFLANGLVSNLGSAFNGLATSMMGHLQGSAMNLAGEAASGSFSLGQTSFYNTSANTFSANKHDSNWTNLHGLHTEQLGSGVLKTTTSLGDAIFDVSPGLSKTHMHISDNNALTGSLNQAYESSEQTAFNESQQYQTALSHFAHRAIQLSQLNAHDLRLGEGVSESASSQYTQALSTMTHIAKDVANRMGISQEEALSQLTSGGIGAHGTFRSDRNIMGRLAQLGTGVSASIDGHMKFDRTSTQASRYHEGVDSTLSAREAKDFNDAMNTVQSFTSTHHLDESHSTAAHLSNQLGADLRDASTASHNFDASHSRAMRVSLAKQYVESNSTQVTADLNQAFPAFVAERVGEKTRDELFSKPSDLQAIQQLKMLGSEFTTHQMENYIAKFGNEHEKHQMDLQYQEQAEKLKHREGPLVSRYQEESARLSQSAEGVNQMSALRLKEKISEQNQLAHDRITRDGGFIQKIDRDQSALSKIQIATEKEKATDGVLPNHTVDDSLKWLHIKKEEQ